MPGPAILPPAEQYLLDRIRSCRKRYRCCNALMLMRLTGWGREYLHGVIGGLRARGLVGWTADVSGSIHVVGEADDFDSRRVNELTDDELMQLAGAMSAIADMPPVTTVAETPVPSPAG